MRKALANFLVSRAESDDKIFFLTGDLGFQVFDEYRNRFPDRYLNVGVAEAGMVGIAAGLAEQGFKPFCYSIASFLMPRAFEQIRFFSGYNGFPLRYIGAGGGFTYGQSGATHHSLDDIGLAKLLPDFHVYVPSGPITLVESLEDSLVSNNSAYIQIGKFGEVDVSSSIETEIDQTLVITYGPIAREVEKATSLHDGAVRLLVLTKIKPFPVDLILLNLEGVRRVLLIEEQFESSGIQMEILSCLQQFKSPASFTRLGPRLEYSHLVQDQDSLRESNGLLSMQILGRLQSEARSC